MSSKVFRLFGYRGGATVATCLLATALAGCSSDSLRFDSPLFMTEGSDTTGSIAPVPLAGVGGNSTYAAAPVTTPQPVFNQPAPLAGNGQAYQPPRVDLPGQQATAGTLTVQQGDTMYSLAQRGGTNVPALMQANGLTDPTQIRVGQVLALPAAANSGAPVQLASTTTPVLGGNPPPQNTMTPPVQQQNQATPTQPLGGTHTVQAGETVYSVARKYGVTPQAVVTQNGLTADAQLRIGQQLSIPAPGQTPTAPQQTQTVTTTPVAEPAVQQVTTAPIAPPTTAEQPQPPVQQTSLGQQQLPEPEAMQGTSFRWPVRGRLISGFGEKQDGAVNDGINIAVPAGTSIRASENGVVIYAGNELQGFGNLVLIRHAEGWVTAYAHNQEMLVDRGDTVQRGQIIARAGSTGNVTSPQLHFEVRKGSQPVDPLQYLSAL